MDGLEYQLNDPEDMPEISRNKRKIKTIVCIFTSFIIILLILVIFSIIYAINLKNKNDNLNIEKSQLNDELRNLNNETKKLIEQNQALQKYVKNVGFDFRLFGEKLSNLSYAKNNIIENSFKYVEELKTINNGNDYQANERNIYDLYIPYPATKRNNKNNRIILFIHGGAWIEGNKEQLDIFCRTYASQGFITATISYTLLVGDKEYNIYRIIDEITAAIQSIKEKLIEREFDGEKLELAIGGGSAGGHLSLLYAYAYAKNSPIPIRFVINICGPISLEKEHFLILKDYNNTLENIDYDSIERAKKEDKIISPNELNLLYLINLFLGRNETKDIEEMFDNEKKEIKKHSEKYKELFNLAQYSFPIYFIDNTTLPTICIYGGKDNIVGITAYANIKKKFDENHNNNIVLVYSRYAPHNPISFDTQNGIDAAREMNFQILNFSSIYFKPDNN